jgi:tetratricopeptide (TPR) repeat protein
LGIRPAAAPWPTTPDRSSTPDNRIVGGLPDRNPHFIGREILLDRMRNELMDHPNAPLVLYGLGGAGKTQLAREYVHRSADRYSVIWWVSANSAQQARASLVGLAERLVVPMQRSTEQTVAGVIARLESREFDYLLVFDGAEDGEIRQLMPTVGGHVIVTSRDPTWAHDPASAGLEVPGFDRTEAIQFLRRRGNHLSGQDADGLARAIGLLPLALEQITALQLATGRPWEELLARLTDPGPGLLSTGQPAHYPHTVSVSLQLALAQLNEANPAAVLIFELFAWLGSEPVSIALLRAGRIAGVSLPLARTLRDPVLLRKAIADISRYGLARLNANAQRVEVQPLMRLALRDILPPDARERAQLNVHAILAAVDPGLPDDLASWDMHREMAPHVLPSGLVDSTVEAAQRTVYHQIRYRYLFGDYRDAGELAEAAITRWQDDDFLGPGHELVLFATRERANALRALGHYQRARELTADAMSRLRDNPDYGDDHPHTLAMAAGLAADLRIAGEYREALRIAEENYRGHVIRYGEASRRTAVIHHNLAVSLRLVGDFTAAETVDRAVLDQQRTAPSLEQSRILLSANALAEDLYGLGRYHDALEVIRMYFPDKPRLQGATDRAVLLAGRTRALALRGIGELLVARESLRTHYHDYVASYGSDHEYTLAATVSYANTLRQLGLIEEAYVNATDALGTYRRAFGQRNPLTLAAEVNLAVILRAQGERIRARQADTVAAEALRDAVGDRHPFTLAATANLATDLSLAGDQAGARHLSEQAYELAKVVRGPNHSDTLAIAGNLAIDRGASEAGERLLEDVLARLRRTLGPAHPMVADVAAGVRIECDIEPPST